MLDLRPYDGVRGQRVEVLLNGAPVESFALNDNRHRYLVRLPAASQKAGENRLRFVFAQTATPGNADKRHLAAAFHSLTVGPADDATLTDLLGRGAPAPSAVAVDGGVPEIEQIGPSVLRFALRLPRGAALRFTPSLHREALAADGTAALRVTIEGEAGGERELWSRVLRARDAALARDRGRAARRRRRRRPAGAVHGRHALRLVHLEGASRARGSGVARATRLRAFGRGEG